MPAGGVPFPSRQRPELTGSSLRKRKCNIAVNGEGCTSCTVRGLECSRKNLPLLAASEPKRSLRAHSPALNGPVATGEETTSGLPPKPICMELTRLYFDVIHDKFHSLFHQPSMIQDVLDNRAPVVLLYGMMTLSARFSKNPFFQDSDARERGRQYSTKCRQFLDLDDVSLITVQACVLLGAAAVAEGKPGVESVYYAAACRIAQLLDLPNRVTVTPLEKEINLRVWWTLCLTDVWSSTGVGLPRLMAHRDDVPLPMDERVFLRLKQEDTNPAKISPRPEASLIAQMIKLNKILAEIYAINSMAVIGQADGAALETDVRNASYHLDEWQAALPDYMRDTPANMVRYASEGLGRTFVALHIGYYHYGQLLFYRFLQQDCHTSVPSTHFYANKCKSYAAHLCELLYAANANPDCEVLYSMVGHILVVSSTVQLYILLFGVDDDEIKIARARLERNFEILQHLRTFWPTLDMSLIRLRAFHQACRVSMNTSFRLDQWMLRFLSEFAQPVDDKFSEAADPSSLRLRNIGAIPSDLRDFLR
ncbi:uncharacterized transcriptional regulatory protein C1327.01c [Aspergillus udagawae]|uniref:Uncharacterized transcriptional regulatory protein C1327.01c n=1 Tax=Aspergillus udagawae TaxID=91492 RepID=A0ABQ1BC16_9EURO|nr:uncharacterized transcriptional regulatory protein C1327.01c [Aspergillus udagawae]GFF98063.1 uncharacterized transcriptional regulatory protein C1327.01c [Aspergillus udagawae]GFG14108.1 uncharacterized transcriptional regulatory protein C1327.01c [Aspergillus udagawae]